jgi:hypothetical protein
MYSAAQNVVSDVISGSMRFTLYLSCTYSNAILSAARASYVNVVPTFQWQLFHTVNICLLINY